MNNGSQIFFRFLEKKCIFSDTSSVHMLEHQTRLLMQAPPIERWRRVAWEFFCKISSETIIRTEIWGIHIL
jgi:hypothetical protein